MRVSGRPGVLARRQLATLRLSDLIVTLDVPNPRTHSLIAYLCAGIVDHAQPFSR